MSSGWDELLYVVTELPESFLRPVPRFDPLCMGACMSDLLWYSMSITGSRDTSQGRWERPVASGLRRALGPSSTIEYIGGRFFGYVDNILKAERPGSE